MLLAKLTKDNALELALSQIDKLGYELRSRGISDQVSRHQIAALALTQQQRIEGELARIELKYKIARLKLEKAVQKASDQADELISWLPNPLARRVQHVKSLVI